MAAVEEAPAVASTAARRVSARRRPRKLPDPPRKQRRPASTSGGPSLRERRVRGPGYQTTADVESRVNPRESFRGKRSRDVFASARAHAPTTKISRTNYQPVILAEFVAAILLTALSPIASKKGQPGLSPYEGKDMVKLGALTVLYLVLALLSTGGRGPGKVAAWFGGLILLAVGINEAANLASELDIFGSAKAAAPAVGAGPQPPGTAKHSSGQG